ncbi:MAG: RNA pseudouridine synthase [Waddliaceae bacterium]|nr:RNA pseudouridine synthase [Waddliaceae bacterium]
MKEPEVLYSDNHLLIISKPANYLSQPDPQGNRENAEDWAKLWVKKDSGKSGNVFLHLAHRLDRPVSGILLCAKTSKALSRLHAQQRSKKIKKTYYALVSGSPKQESGILENDWVKKEFHAEISPRGTSKNPQAKACSLAYEVVRKNQKNTLLRVHLVTGRYHQIRAQLAAISCPIVGDQKYGSKVQFQRQEIALHHGELSLVHPTTNEMITIKAELPYSFELLSS